MVKLIVKCLLILIVFLLGVMYGMRQPGGSVVSDNHQTDIVTDTGETVKNLSAHQVPDNQGKVASGKPNHFSQVGEVLSTAVTGLFRGAVKVTSTIFEEVSSKKDQSNTGI